jgi:hypothetical protein
LTQLIENKGQGVSGGLPLFRSTFLRSQRSEVRILSGVPTPSKSPT